MARAIDSEVAFRFLTEQLVKETGAFSKGVNKGLNIARSAMRNPDAIPTLTPPNEWVSVEERLPAPTENLVLVYDCTGVNMAWYSYAMGWKYRTGLPGVEITHWMPLPEPPKEETP